MWIIRTRLAPRLTAEQVFDVDDADADGRHPERFDLAVVGQDLIKLRHGVAHRARCFLFESLPQGLGPRGDDDRFEIGV